MSQDHGHNPKHLTLTGSQFLSLRRFLAPMHLPENSNHRFLILLLSLLFHCKQKWPQVMWAEVPSFKFLKKYPSSFDRYLVGAQLAYALQRVSPRNLRKCGVIAVGFLMFFVFIADRRGPILYINARKIGADSFKCFCELQVYIHQTCSNYIFQTIYIAWHCWNCNKKSGPFPVANCCLKLVKIRQYFCLKSANPRDPWFIPYPRPL